MSSTFNIAKIKRISKLKHIDFYNIFLTFVSILILIAISLLIINPNRYIKSINSGISLFFYSVFPSIFPFIFLTKILEELGTFEKFSSKISNLNSKIIKLPNLTYFTMLISFICGYPLGAKLIGELKKENQISTSEAKKMICLSSTSGPIFVIGVVGVSMFNSYKFGALLFLCHLLGCTLAGLLIQFFVPYKENLKKLEQKKSYDNLLNKTTISTINSVIVVAVYVSIFYMFIDMAYDLKILDFLSNLFTKILEISNIDIIYSKGLSSGIIEITRGLSEVSQAGCNTFSLMFCSLILSFGGLSIILQTLTFLSGTNISTKFVLGLKSLQSIFSLVIALIVGLIVY